MTEITTCQNYGVIRPDEGFPDVEEDIARLLALLLENDSETRTLFKGELKAFKDYRDSLLMLDKFVGQLQLGYQTLALSKTVQAYIF